MLAHPAKSTRLDARECPRPGACDRYRSVMDHERYVQIAHEADAAFGDGRHDEAARTFQDLVRSSALPDMDRSVMAINLATVLQKMGADPRQIEWAFDQGIALERRWYRGNVREHKAAWLAQEGRTTEAAALYQQLLTEGWASSGERSRWQRNVTALAPR